MTVEDTTKRERPGGLRRPSRGRGIARFQSLLEATEELLRSANPDEIGLYQIAEQAGVPPASVYHFFPTKEAAYQALAEQHLEGLLQVHSQPIEARLIGSWADLTLIDMRRGMEFSNANVPAMKILYGGYGGVEARKIDELVTEQIAGAYYPRLNRVFHVPPVPDAARKAKTALSILDAIWSLSVRSHGYITEDYFEESTRAVLAYRRLYFPEHLAPRPFLTEAAKNGESLTLPFQALEADEDPSA